MKYKTYEDSPKDLTISTFWSGSFRGFLREGLPYDHEENQYNWFIRTYPDLNPEFYNIEKPLKPGNRCIENLKDLR